ncbi:MAG: M20/M25/M40 family metallo-hydrolase [Melioribacteraceae bacterium]|nr:M20/M25/M40 family metallo-hydrolase [Melioribacteraceae bacterium]
MKKLKLSLFVLFSFNAFLFSQNNSVTEKIISEGKSNNKTMFIADVLCNRFGGRVTGSAAYTNAANWVYDELKNYGLKVQYDEVGSVPVGFNRGAWFGKMIKPQIKTLEFGTPSYTAGTKGVQQGHVVIYPKDESLIEIQKDKFKNAWVLIDGISEGLARDRDSVISLTKKLVSLGALGTIQSSKLPIRLLDSRSVNDWNNLPTLCDIKLLDSQYDEIKSLVEKGEEVILEFDIRNHFVKGPIKYHNVIGVIPGVEKKDEYVILGAHLDSYDAATGAVDNASGVAPMIEAVRLLMKAGAKPKRSIMIQIYAAEERGLVGSKSWVNKNKNLLPKISVMFNKDFGTNPIVGVSVPKTMINDFELVSKEIEKANLKYPFKVTEMGKFRKAGRGGTDSHSFLMENVPTPYLRSEGPQKYGRTWHTLFDTYNELIPDALEDASIKIALLAYGIANLDHLLERKNSFLDDGVYADLNTNKGRITLKLDYENVPMTVSNFVGLAEGTIRNKVFPEGKPYFNGSIWHRVVPGHVIQAGKPSINDTIEGPGYEFPNEIFSKISHNKAGMLGMANAGPHTNGSQFYITLADRSYLDGNYTLFGWVEEGMDVVNKIVQGDTIKTVSIVRIGEKANKFKPNTDSFLKMVEEAREKVKAENLKQKKLEDDIINKEYSKTILLDNGIRYSILKNGEGEKLNTGDKIKVVYKGKVLSKDISFVSTNENGRANNSDIAESFDYEIGKSKINDGFDLMISDMKVGEKRLVIIPSGLAFAERGFYGITLPNKKRLVISPNSTLVYEIEILSKIKN